ncbi:WAPL domain-containing protein [Fusarium keratoplasticum]|uniref:WAPL domain-containing protein n=1 Tax=Fusarium keratoplasticum TaxID=1328300 RepID=A0ACC0QMK0_9HYPO|nr:WAPL domain-containing protein [Fusarium keratoplasticum]KAI8657329.1 WAPL domain-containing protein [Fusarium keratoplasticum]KAI8658301.1 WAPL domain-containing protein [Fusarium keratoplasticum]
MASRNGSTAPTPRKLVTYGKPSRKRHMQSAVPLRTAELYTTSSSHVEPAEPVAKPSVPSLPRSTSDPSPRLHVNSRPSAPDGSSRAKAGEGQKTESRDATDSKKRKRLQAALAESMDDDGAPSPQKQPKPTKTLPRHPPAATSQNDAKTPGLPGREPLMKKSPKDAGARSRLLPRSKSDISATKSSLGPTPIPKNREPEVTRPKKRRPRLIDALAAQRPDSSDSDDSAPEVDHHSPPSPVYSGAATPSQQSQDNSQTNSQYNSQDAVIRPRARPAGVQGRRIKYTYGQSRSILSESSKLSEPGMGAGMATTEEELDALLASPPPPPINPDPFDMSDDDLDEDGDVRPAIKSVHELRRAGANNRFADEMEDLLARIGTPSSSPSTMRRNALLELAQKLQNKDFIGQFRDHATRDKIASNIGQEEDVISGFALTAVLVTFLNFSDAAHLLRQLVEDGLGKLLGVLLHASEDIDEIVQRKMRLSKMSRASVSQVKTLLMKMDIWQGRHLQELSPQTLALQLLNIVCQRIDPLQTSGVIRDIESDLTVIMERCTTADPSTNAVFALVVSILETQSSQAVGDEEEVSWVSQQTSKVACFLNNSLRQWPEKPGSVETTTLKLSINMSNTAHGAAAFNDEVLLARLSSCMRAGFKSALDALSNRRLRGETYDGLLLVLGVAINILEHCPPARANIAGEPLDGLVTLYLQNQASMSEADSVEKSQLTVAFGYLAVLLGYLSLIDSARQRFAEQAGSGGISSLISSIQEFIGMYRSVDNKVTELEGLVNDLQIRQRMK